jgi:ribonuclease-3
VDIDFDKLERLLGHSFNERDFALRALTHPSFEHERVGEGNYQRLEFLGDAVLGMLLAEALYNRFPDGSEGDLSRFRAQLAGQDALAGIARKCGLGRFIRLGRGEDQTGGQDKDSILADVLESLIAAVYLDGGLETVRRMVMGLFDEYLDNIESAPKFTDAKSAVQESLSVRHLSPPCYRLVEETGPPHARQYRFQVLVDDEVVGEGEGRSKKAAQQAAAGVALEKLSGGSRQG